MRAVASQGFPVPVVYSVDGADMTMDRVDGVELLSLLSKRSPKSKLAKDAKTKLKASGLTPTAGK